MERLKIIICDNQNIFDIKKSVLICDNLWTKKENVKICGDMTKENKTRLIKFLWNLASAILAAVGTALGVSCAVMA